MNLEAFYDEYVDTVYKFFYIKCLNRHVAEDLTADTFTAFLKNVQNTEVQDHKKYLYGIMRHIWTNFLREKYEAQLTDIESIESFEEYATSEITDFEASEEPVSRLMPYVKRLPEKQRAVVMLRAFQHLSVKDAADALGKDANYIKTTYARAIRSLRAIVDNPYLERKETV